MFMVCTETKTLKLVSIRDQYQFKSIYSLLQKNAVNQVSREQKITCTAITFKLQKVQEKNTVINRKGGTFTLKN